MGEMCGLIKMFFKSFQSQKSVFDKWFGESVLVYVNKCVYNIKTIYNKQRS